MGILAQHVPSIEQLKPGLIEVIEEAGGSKQFFCMFKTYLLGSDKMKRLLSSERSYQKPA